MFSYPLMYRGGNRAITSQIFAADTSLIFAFGLLMIKQAPGGFPDKFVKKMVEKQTDDFMILVGSLSVFL
jgi:hypothetical protein